MRDAAPPHTLRPLLERVLGEGRGRDGHQRLCAPQRHLKCIEPSFPFFFFLSQTTRRFEV